MKTLTVRLPESLCDEITRDAEARKISKSEVIRLLLEEALAGPTMSWIDELDDLEAFELMAQLLNVAREVEAIVENPPKPPPRKTKAKAKPKKTKTVRAKKAKTATAR